VRTVTTASSSGPGRVVPGAGTETVAMGQLREQVRDFLRRHAEAGRFTPWVDTWLTVWDEDFTRELAAQGWVGMTIPTDYGGRGRSFMERFVVTEELLVAGAPVAAQWVADRQIAPTLLRFGSEQQKRRYLPRIARGECCFGIGMSEPDAGSDLAAVRTQAERVDGGWRLTGTKVWTSGAHRAEAFFALARSAPPDPADRHAGLTQFIVDLGSEGVEIRPIVSMTGSRHFNEVHLEGVFVPDEQVLGEAGAGWHQVTSELGFERSGPERFLSTFGVYAALVEEMASGRIPADPRLGELLGRMRGLHQMSMAVSGALQRAEPADTAAALVKILGTTFEGDITELADLLSPPARLVPGVVADQEEAIDRTGALIAAGLLQRPGFTLRGGTNEILRGVVARGLGMR
jgi:acyl-CoA dehydrogenase